MLNRKHSQQLNQDRKNLNQNRMKLNQGRKKLKKKVMKLLQSPANAGGKWSLYKSLKVIRQNDNPAKA